MLVKPGGERGDVALLGVVWDELAGRDAGMVTVRLGVLVLVGVVDGEVDGCAGGMLLKL